MFDNDIENVQHCPFCDSTDIYEKWVNEIIDYGEGIDAAKIPVRVPLSLCGCCNMKFYDYRWEDIHDEAVKKYLISLS